MRSMRNSKILVITTATYVSWMFQMFWYYGINNVIILVYGRRRSKLVTCNRFAPENDCGKTAKLFIVHDCEEQLSLSFTNVIHQMNKCPINLLLDERSVFSNENHVHTRTTQYVLKELSHHLNATFQRIMIHGMWEADDLLRGMNVFKWGTEEAIGNDDVTEPLIRIDMVWLVPEARQISNMDVFLGIFTYDVWIATIVVFICVWLIWFLIISRNGGFTFDKLCLSFLNVWSLTIFGNVAQLPRPISLSLRILLLFYLFYAINMQFAFTSDMSTVLTAPQYDFQIRNLEELADSQLPIYTFDKYKGMFFENNYTDRKLYTKLQNSIHGVTFLQHVLDLLDLHLHGNYAVVASPGDIWHIQTTLNKKIEGYKITDNSITSTHKIHLKIIFNHCFKTTLNTFIRTMIESGIHEKRINDFHRSKFDVESTTPADDLITLKHLSFIFVFFGFGLCTACVL